LAFDEGLAQRIRDHLDDRRGVTERKMFGGAAFMIGGNMCCGVVGDELMVRVGPDAYDEALRRPHAREMDFTGKPMRGMLYVGTKGIDTDKDLATWIERGAAFASSLPGKMPQKPKKPRESKK
jgi:TfoX/Sxy family transcriptional regulator of competence genes